MPSKLKTTKRRTSLKDISTKSKTLSTSDKKKIKGGLLKQTGEVALQSDKAFDIEIPEFSLEVILTGSSEITAQNIVDLFRMAMKTRQKEILCWYYYYKVYED